MDTDHLQNDSLLDLVYLDEDRVGSLLSQLVGGLVTGGQSQDAASDERVRRIRANLSILSAGRDRTDTTTSSETFTWTVGHSVLLDFQAELQRRGMLIDVTAILDSAPAILPREWYDGMVRDALTPGAFVSVTGPTKLYDFQAMIASMRQAYSLGLLFGRLEESQQPDTPRSTKQRPKIKQVTQDPLVAAASELEQFLSDRVLVRSYPLGADDPHHFVGPIKRQHLLESAWTFYAKYGYSPVEDLTMFGQVALVPDDVADEDLEKDDSSIAQAAVDLEGLLDAMVRAYPNDLLATARWPRVTVTPIAVYRRLSLQPVSGDG